jgi:hypothetical protein
MAASIQITYVRDTITVRHGETNEVLYSRPASQEDWIRIWDAIKYEENIINITPIKEDEN